MAAFNPISKLQSYYAELWKAVIRPPRDHYQPADLGSRKFMLQDDGRTYIRTDFEVVNRAGQRLMCSHHEPHRSYRVAQKLPCVIYLHGNCSSRLEAFCALQFLLPLNITVVGFDFAGSGLSDGEWVTLGHNEVEDLTCVIDYLRENRNISTVAVWGRSMGAVTAILGAERDATIMGIVCDSPFHNLRKLAEEIADEFLPFKLPQMLTGGAINMVRNTIIQKSGFDIDSLDIAKSAANCTPPALFITGTSDFFIRTHHATTLMKAYRGEKWLVQCSGDHNSPRSTRLMYTTAVFLYNALQCETLFEALDVPERALGYWRKLEENVEALTLFPSARLNAVTATIITEPDGTDLEPDEAEALEAEAQEKPPADAEEKPPAEQKSMGELYAAQHEAALAAGGMEPRAALSPLEVSITGDRPGMNKLSSSAALIHMQPPEQRQLPIRPADGNPPVEEEEEEEGSGRHRWPAPSRPPSSPGGDQDEFHDPDEGEDANAGAADEDNSPYDQGTSRSRWPQPLAKKDAGAGKEEAA